MRNKSHIIKCIRLIPYLFIERLQLVAELVLPQIREPRAHHHLGAVHFGAVHLGDFFIVFPSSSHNDTAK